ncbi:MAG: hypothetical protein GW911_15475 [Armatimonadetes bacterium]|nr:hypothetical protein [Armatimonadota bacterium]PIU93867.1 MAG: hypothetical protein COS65_10585 [Armatimonadetes bacterium CG06_land_8_20_14_3_00_66_21]PIX50177.1 MAG: hypothetical protein COZ57_00240 [Armatimonadetes bacterium CG_4_8_14_3_um_filter_66_20]PJB61855.1 MAG: hypothetical protein CO096_27200 [Armatimonadetes bacterium CG_4_9_14_3_um_filter_66_14]NCO92066.1 hypothetical protein [Armatimonadota bacterium]
MTSNPIPSSHRFETTCGDWQVALDFDTCLLSCAHPSSGARVDGRLCFEATFDGAAGEWSVALARDAVADRLALVDGRGDVQGYVQFAGTGGTLRLLCLHRAAQNYPGTLKLLGEARLGADSFACRTRPPGISTVVQMASGPADSGLNDSLFDVVGDTVLRFGGDSVALTSSSGQGNEVPTFGIELSARIDSAGASALVFSVEQHYYRDRYVPRYRPRNKRRCPSAPTGWMSWNVYFDQAGEKENLDEARIAAKHLKPFGLEIWSIESWQENSDTLPVRKFHNLTLKAHPGQFPHGMKWLADQIRKLGFRPGIWTAPFGTGEEAFYQAHKRWFLHDADGKPMSNWCGNYVLDPSQPAVRKHLREMHRVMADEWGYEFFKIDGMSGRGPSYSAHFFERPEVRAAFRHPAGDPFALCVKAFRDGIGEKAIFLACQGHYTAPEVTYCDAARIGADIVSPNQPSQWHNVLAQARWTLNQLFVNNLLWYGDPDTLLVGDYHTVEVARMTTSIVTLSGQMMFAGDKLGELSAERMRLLQQALPVCDIRPLDLFPIYDLAPVWDVKIRRPFGQWDVVSLLNWTDREQEVNFTFEDLGLPEGGRYLLYEFWTQQFRGAHEGRFRATLPPRSSQLLAVHPATGRPQFLSTDRHVTQGGVSLKRLRWDDRTETLSGTVQLVRDHPTRLVFHVPAGFAFQSARADKAEIVDAHLQADRTLTLQLLSTRTRNVNWRLSVPRDDRPG